LLLLILGGLFEHGKEVLACIIFFV
jgi:hypothetical protein